MMRVQWPAEIPDFLSAPAQAWPRGELVHHSLWPQQGHRDKICFGDKLSEADVIRMLAGGTCRSVVQYNPDVFDQDLRAALNLRHNPLSYFSDPGATVLGGAEASWSWTFSERSEKQELKDRIVGVASPGTDAGHESLGLIFEELFMNAMIDAPRESAGKGNPPGKSQMTLTRLGNRLCLSCEDPYGSLKISKFVNRIGEVYSQGAGQVINFNAERGGAGLGCVLLFEHSSTMTLGVVDSQKTVVSCVIPMDLNNRQRDQVFKGFNWIDLSKDGKSV